MNTLFVAFVGLVLAAVAATVRQYLSTRNGIQALWGLAVWITYASVTGYWGGQIASTGGPPLPVLLSLPAIGTCVFLARSNFGRTLATSVPVKLLILLECFRVGVELFLHQLWRAGLVPRMLTYEGANFDILVGATAPLVAWLLVTRRIGRRSAIAWNVAGILILGNTVARSVLTTPGPMHYIVTDIANQALTRFPFTFLPGFLAPLAMMLHVLAIRGSRAAPNVQFHPPISLPPLKDSI